MEHVATPTGALELSMASSYCSDMEYCFYLLNIAIQAVSYTLCQGGLRVAPLEPACGLVAVS